MCATQRNNLMKVGKKISDNRTKCVAASVLSQYTIMSSSSDLKMNHDKKAEHGKRILRALIKSAT